MNDTRKRGLKGGKIAILLMATAALVWGCAGTKMGKRIEKEEAVVAASKQIIGVQAIEAPESVDIRVAGNQTLTYTSVKQPSPTGVILYFPETTFLPESVQTDQPEGSDTIESIRMTGITETGGTARLEILLKRDLPYEVKRDGDDLIVSIAKISGDVASEPATEPSGSAPMKKTAGSNAAATATRLISVSAHPSEDSVELNIAADGTIGDYKSFTIKNPARIVFDLFNIGSPSEKEQLIPVDTPWVKQVRHYGYPDRVRIVLDTEERFLSAFNASPTDDGLSIRVGAGKTESAAPAVSATAPASGPAWVNRIDFSSEENGKSVVVIGTTLPVNYDLKKSAENRLNLELHNARLPDYRRRPLVTTRFESAVDRITPIQSPESRDSSMVIIELRESVPYFAEQTDNLLMIHFEPSSIPPKPMDSAALPEWQRVMEESISVAEPMAAVAPVVESAEGAAGEPTLGAPVQQQTTQDGDATVPSPEAGEKQYTGEKIALDFYETDIKNVFRIMREISGKNFAVDKDVSGQVTLSLDKPVPWDQVLDLILKMNQLGMTMEGDIVRIATLQTLNNEREINRSKMAAERETQQQAEALEPLITEYIPVNYANADTDVLPQIVTSPERGKATVDARNNQIIITDTAAMVKQARETVLRIDKVTPQVMIEARVVEATNTFSREIGTQWGMQAGPYFNQAVAGGVIPEGAIDLTMAATNPVAGLGSLGLSFTKLEGTPLSLLNAQLTASETRGMIKIISAPRILTLDNKTALIKQGLAYPLTRLDAEGNTTVEFQDVALELEVTPHVTPDNRISLAIKITNNEIGAVINNETSFTTKEANTELLVNDGDTVVIGGIRKTTKRDGESGLPTLKDISLLGWLFKSTEKTDDLEELLIFITPKIVLLEQRS